MKNRVSNESDVANAKVPSHADLKRLVKKISATDSDAVKDDVYKLVNGDVMALELTDFLNETACNELVETVLKFPLDMSYLGNKANKILESQHNRQNDPDAYFQGAATHALLREKPVVGAVGKILSLLKYSKKKVSIAFDPNRKMYYCPAIIREFHSTLKLHNDNAAREAHNWIPIQNVSKQFAFVLKLTSCRGGQTRWYPRQWKVKDEIYFNHKDNYSYDEEVVASVPKVMFEGVIGTLILFNCKCYHAVEQVIEGRRYTLGGFIGLLEETDELVIWS